MISFLMIPRKCGIQKFRQSGRLVDPPCQQSTKEHTHPFCGHFSHPYVTDYQSCKFQVYAGLKVMVHIYILYIFWKYIFDASVLWKEMVDIILVTFLELS